MERTQSHEGKPSDHLIWGGSAVRAGYRPGPGELAGSLRIFTSGLEVQVLSRVRDIFEIPPFVGERVLVAGWMLLVGDPFEHTMLDEPAEALIEHVPGDPEAGLEVVEPPDPEKGVAQDQ